jgi:hypothetical protein
MLAERVFGQSAKIGRLRVAMLLSELRNVQGLGFSHHCTTRWRFTSGDLRPALSRWMPAYRAISPHLYFQYTFSICRVCRVITSHAPASILARFVY